MLMQLVRVDYFESVARQMRQLFWIPISNGLFDQMVDNLAAEHHRSAAAVGGPPPGFKDSGDRWVDTRGLVSAKVCES